MPASTTPASECPVQSVVVHGYRRAYRRVGSGSPLLLIHGIGDSSRTWLPVLDRLAAEHDCIAPDLLGHGDSDKPRADYAVAAYACGMRDLLDILGVERVTLVGHSLGGGVTAQFAYQFPERVERMVLVSSGGVARDVHPFLRLAAGPGAELTLPIITSTPMRWMTRRLRPLLRATGGLGFGSDIDYILDRFDGMRDTTTRVAFLRTLRAGVDAHGQAVTMLDRAYLAAPLPTMLIWGDRDGMIPVSHAHIAAEAMPGSWLEIFEGSGHFPHHDDPDRFVDALLGFIAATDPGSFDRDRWRAALAVGRSMTSVRALRPIAKAGASGA